MYPTRARLLNMLYNQDPTQPFPQQCCVQYERVEDLEYTNCTNRIDRVDHVDCMNHTNRVIIYEPTIKANTTTTSITSITYITSITSSTNPKLYDLYESRKEDNGCKLDTIL